MILPTYQAKTSCVWRGKYSEREFLKYVLDRLFHLLGARHPFTYVTESHVVLIFLQLKARIFSQKSACFNRPVSWHVKSRERAGVLQGWGWRRVTWWSPHCNTFSPCTLKGRFTGSNLLQVLSKQDRIWLNVALSILVLLNRVMPRGHV